MKANASSRSTGTPSSDAGYVPALDGVRAVAALLVVFFHLRLGFANGDIGVDVFFVLSGFLITGILLRAARRGPVSFKTFYWRRALRLLPVYFAVVAVSVSVAFIGNLGGGTLRGALSSLFYVSNWVAGEGMGLGLLAHTWSLSIEEQFYLIWPLTLVLLLHWVRGDRRKSAIAVAGMVALCYASIVFCWAVGAPEGFAWNLTPARGMQLLFGCLLALLLSDFGEIRLPGRLRRLPDLLGLASIAGLIVIANLRNSDGWLEMLGQWPIVAMLTVLVLIACVSPGPSLIRGLLSLAPLVAIGKVSYGLYLWHFPVMYALDDALGMDSWGVKALAVALTAAIVPLSYRYLELPFLRMKDRKFAKSVT